MDVNTNPPDWRAELAAAALITPKRAAQLLGVHPLTLRRWRAQGRLRIAYLSDRGMRCARYYSEDIARLIETSTAGGAKCP